MRVEVRSLGGGAEVVEVTASAKLSFERRHKKPLDAELRSGMLEPLYDVVHEALRIQNPDTPEALDEWLATVADVVLLPGDPFAYFLSVCSDMSADDVDHVATVVQSIAELKRAGAATPEPDEVPTGGDPTASTPGSPEPSSGRGSPRKTSSRSKKETPTSTKPSS